MKILRTSTKPLEISNTNPDNSHL